MLPPPSAVQPLPQRCPARPLRDRGRHRAAKMSGSCYGRALPAASAAVAQSAAAARRPPSLIRNLHPGNASPRSRPPEAFSLEIVPLAAVAPRRQQRRSPDHPHWRHQRSVFSPSSPGESAANSWTSDTRDAGSVWPKALRHWSWEVDAGTSPPRPSHHTQRRDHNPDDRQAAAAKATTNSAVTCQ